MVYKAKSRTEDHQCVAIKEINLRRMKDRHREATHREMTILSQLDHPNIVQLYAVYSIPQTEKVFLVTEFLRGGDILSALSQMSTYFELDAKRIFRQIVNALCYLHDQRVIHRDIKPLNILLSEMDFRKSTVKMVDFGFATLEPVMNPTPSSRKLPTIPMDKSLNGQTSAAQKQRQPRLLCGTPGYIAPEVYMTRQYTRQVDVWSLGCVLYLMLSGTMPFAASKNGIQAVKAGFFTFPVMRFQHVSSEAMDLMVRMLIVNPKERFTIAQVRDHAWLKEPGLDDPHRSSSDDSYMKYELTENLQLLQSHSAQKRGGMLDQLWQGWQKWQEPKRLSRRMKQEHRHENKMLVDYQLQQPELKEPDAVESEEQRDSWDAALPHLDHHSYARMDFQHCHIGAKEQSRRPLSTGTDFISPVTSTSGSSSTYSFSLGKSHSNQLTF
jgi:serine/threonine protein kinase